jgi:hypothetical protein
MTYPRSGHKRSRSLDPIPQEAKLGAVLCSLLPSCANAFALCDSVLGNEEVKWNVKTPF